MFNIPIILRSSYLVTVSVLGFQFSKWHSLVINLVEVHPSSCIYIFMFSTEFQIVNQRVSIVEIYIKLQLRFGRIVNIVHPICASKQFEFNIEE